MYANLAKQILQTLPQRSVDDKTPIDEKLQMCLRTVTTLDDLLDALLLLERVVGSRVGLELTRYRWTQLIKDQADRLPKIRSEALPLYQAYRTVGAALRKTLEKGSGSKSKRKDDSALAQVIRRITVDDPQGYKGVDEFLTAVREFLVLSLWVSARRPAGQQLLEALTPQTQASVTIDLRPKLGRSSLLAFVPPGGDGAYGQEDTSGNPFRVDWFEKAEPIIKGTGSPTRLGAPVWLPRGKDDGPDAPDALQNEPYLFVGYVTVEEALIRILLGSVSFLQNRGVFYTPPRIELMHELIHVLHNACGTNRETVLKAEFADVWTNAEEYWTIDGGPITENHFNAEVGLPRRAGHRGIPLDALDPTSEEAQENSFATLSGSPA